MNHKKRTLALLLCIAFLLLWFTSSAYLIKEADHHCDGEHCEVCENMKGVWAILHIFRLMIRPSLVGFALLCLFLFLLSGKREVLPPHGTLVSLKVRLDD